MAEPAIKEVRLSLVCFGAFFDQPWRENDYLWGRPAGSCARR
jgi:hypothetical protein